MQSWLLVSTVYLDEVVCPVGNGKYTHLMYPQSSTYLFAHTYRFFLVEGIFTILFGISLWWIFPDCKKTSSVHEDNEGLYLDTVPEQAKWLTDKEKRFLQARLPANAPRSSESDFNVSEIWESLKDQRLWWFTLIWATKTIGGSGLSFYLPTIVADLGLV